MGKFKCFSSMNMKVYHQILGNFGVNYYLVDMSLEGIQGIFHKKRLKEMYLLQISGKKRLSGSTI